jgi:hypothetical protein
MAANSQPLMPAATNQPTKPLKILKNVKCHPIFTNSICDICPDIDSITDGIVITKILQTSQRIEALSAQARPKGIGFIFILITPSVISLCGLLF